MAIKTTRWDSAEFLKTEEDIKFYLEACLEEGGEDPAFLVHALGVVARAKNMSQLAEDGANIFRVEASLPFAPDLLRPGMEGIGKINAGRERLVWIWTHEIIDWFRLWVWSWWP